VHAARVPGTRPVVLARAAALVGTAALPGDCSLVTRYPIHRFPALAAMSVHLGHLCTPVLITVIARSQYSTANRATMIVRAPSGARPTFPSEEVSVMRDENW
jgi:hypothetical protein